MLQQASEVSVTFQRCKCFGDTSGMAQISLSRCSRR